MWQFNERPVWEGGWMLPAVTRCLGHCCVFLKHLVIYSQPWHLSVSPDPREQRPPPHIRHASILFLNAPPYACNSPSLPEQERGRQSNGVTSAGESIIWIPHCCFDVVCGDATAIYFWFPVCHPNLSLSLHPFFSSHPFCFSVSACIISVPSPAGRAGAGEEPGTAYE